MLLAFDVIVMQIIPLFIANNKTSAYRQGPLDIDPMLALSLEDQLQRDLAQASEDSGSEDESDALPLEWENVCFQLKFLEMKL